MNADIKSGYEGKYGHGHTLCSNCCQSLLVPSGSIERCCQCGNLIAQGQSRTWTGEDMPKNAHCKKESFIIAAYTR